MGKSRKRNRKQSKKARSNEFRAQKIRCAPKKYEELNMFSCFTDKTLFRLRDAWNSKNPADPIREKTGDEIHKQLSLKLKPVCKSEPCWLEKLLGSAEEIKEISDQSFAPLQPDNWVSNPNEWLSSDEIIAVMKQFENAYKCFKFIGPSPIDFDKKLSGKQCVWNELCRFNVAQLMKQGKNKIGIIYNTDPHTKGGQHWISMFINFKKGQIYFFDSVGDTAPEEIKEFVERVKQQGKALGINFKYDENHPVEHQYGNTECGIYSLFFVVHMLQDKITQHYLKTHVLKDKYMEDFRNKYFNKKGTRRRGGGALKMDSLDGGKKQKKTAKFRQRGQ